MGLTSMLQRSATAMAVVASLLPTAVWGQTTKGGAPAAAPVSADPQTTTATYGDWVLRCQRQGEGNQATKACEVVQSLQLQGQTAPIVQIAIGRPAPKDPLKIALVIAPNVSFPSSPLLAVDEKDPQPASLTWRRCLPGGCMADAVIKDDILKRWRAQNERGRLQVKDAADRDMVLPFSFRGLAEALDALNKS
jgi:invasion protein IalB